MSNYKIKHIKKKFLIFLLFFSLSFGVTYADKIKDFKISGNDRISDETIILFSGLKINDSLDQNSINLTIKKLYETSFFSNLSIKYENNIYIFNCFFIN